MAMALYQHDMLKLIERSHKPKMFAFKPMPIKVELTETKIIDVIQGKGKTKGDPLLGQELRDAAQEVFEERAKELAKLLSTLEDEAERKLKATGNPDSLNLIRKLVPESFAKAAKEADAEATRAAEAAWERYKKTHSEYRGYKIKLGVTMALSGVTIVGSVASAGISAATGAVPGIFISMYGAAQAFNALLKSISDTVTKTEQVAAKLQRDIRKVEADYRNAAKKAANTAKEVAKRGLGKIMGIDMIPSLKTLDADAGLYKSKLDGLYVKAHDAAKKLEKALDDAEAAGKQLKLLPEALRKQVEPRLDKLEASVKELIETVMKLYERTRTGLAKLEDLKKQIENVKKAVNTKAADVASGAFEILFDLGLVASGTFASGLPDLSKALTTAQFISDEALNLANFISSHHEKLKSAFK